METSEPCYQQENIPSLSSSKTTRVTQGHGECPGKRGDAHREQLSGTGRAGWAQAAGTDDMPPDSSSSFLGRRRGAPHLHNGAARLE